MDPSIGVIPFFILFLFIFAAAKPAFGHLGTLSGRVEAKKSGILHMNTSGDRKVMTYMLTALVI